jgi:hypothetical protein
MLRDEAPTERGGLRSAIVSKRIKTPLDYPWRSLVVLTTALLEWWWWFDARYIAEVDRMKATCAGYDPSECVWVNGPTGFALTVGYLLPLAFGVLVLGGTVLTLLGVCVWRFRKRRRLPPAPPMPAG